MKNTFSYIILSLIIAGCWQSGGQVVKKDATDTLNLPVKKFEYYIAGYLKENSRHTVALLGPGNEKWIIKKTDIISDQTWDGHFDGLNGAPALLILKFGSIIKTRHGILTIGQELPDLNNPDVEKPRDCDCLSSLQPDASCCYINGYRAYCTGKRWILTTEPRKMKSF